MSRYISEKTRLTVAERANFCCEYCLLPEDKSFFSFHIEHIISLKHGGTSAIDNLAFACQICNLNKGSDIATFLNTPTNLVRFFNPRIDKWNEHFELENSGFIYPITTIAEATIKILDINQIESIIERKLLIERELLVLK